MLGDHFIKAQLALLGWKDGGLEGINGCLGVCFVIRNRQRAGWYGGNWIDILSHHQDWAADDRQYDLTLPQPNDHTFRTLLQEIDGIFAGTREDDVTKAQTALSQDFRYENAQQTAVALYYGRLDDPDLRPWFRESVCQGKFPIATVGGLSFFN